MHRSTVLFAGLVVAAALPLAGCGDTRSAPAGTSGTKSAAPGNTMEKGICADTCPAACVEDNDCETSVGELCCDFGRDGKACTPARECPRLCSDDTRCDAESGEACVRVTLGNTAKICASASDAVAPCKHDADCTAPGQVCCQALTEPLCVSGADCPTPCKQSSECDTSRGELCCDGHCNDSCERCSTSSDCDAQICCKTRAAFSGLRIEPADEPTGGVITVAPSCVPGTVSVPGGSRDPCQQNDPVCPASQGYVATNTCQPDGHWSPICDCVPGAPPPVSGAGGSFSGDPMPMSMAGVGGAGTAGSPGSPRPDVNCTATNDCGICCQMTTPVGWQTFQNIVRSCSCGLGVCGDVCQAPGFCLDAKVILAINSGCLGCIVGSCGDYVMKCAADPDCGAYLECANACAVGP